MKHDYKGIAKLFKEADNIGNNNGQLKCLADIPAERINWLWENRIQRRPSLGIASIFWGNNCSRLYLSNMLMINVENADNLC